MRPDSEPSNGSVGGFFLVRHSFTAELLKNALNGPCKGLRGRDCGAHVRGAKATVNFSGCEVWVEVGRDRDTKVQDARTRPVKM
jgi:hypothetical protein